MNKGTLLSKVLPGVLILIAMASSITIEKLDAVRAKASIGVFDPKAFAVEFWEHDLMPNLSGAVELDELIELLQNNPELAFERYSKALGIGNIRFFMVKGAGEIRTIGENDITVVIKSNSDTHAVKIATEYVFGNAVRDASGKVNIQEFENTMDFNNVSAEINALIREKILPSLKRQASVGSKITFAGAIELNREQVNIRQLEIIPVSAEFLETGQHPEN